MGLEWAVPILIINSTWVFMQRFPEIQRQLKTWDRQLTLSFLEKRVSLQICLRRVASSLANIQWCLPKQASCSNVSIPSTAHNASSVTSKSALQSTEALSMEICQRQVASQFGTVKPMSLRDPSTLSNFLLDPPYGPTTPNVTPKWSRLKGRWSLRKQMIPR